MFTGIVEELGEVVAVDPVGDDAARLAVRGELVAGDARHGDSICVNGVCLTVTHTDGHTFAADVMGETLRRSSLGALRPGSPVNLERAATLGTRLGGHLVQGHVDGVGHIVGREPAEAWETLTVAVPPELGRYVVEKGSITIDGVSLTVAAVHDDGLSVAIIPHTSEVTTLGRRGPGDAVNLEVDVTAKHVERLLDWYRSTAP
jgi:riboflavin synthase